MNVALYARTALNGPAGQTDCARQVAALHLLAAEMEWTIVGIYLDVSTGGSYLHRREQARIMIGRAKEQGAEAIAVRDLAVLGQPSFVLRNAVGELRRAGYQVYIGKDNATEPAILQALEVLAQARPR